MEAPPQIPILARWRDDIGAPVDVRMQWDEGLPHAMPVGADTPLCTLWLCAPALSGASGAPPEHLEARLHRHHLHGEVARWTPERLARLMGVMAASDPDESQAAGVRDEVVVRRGATRLVIDVVFGADGKAVEILNAYPSSSSSRACSLELLRSAVLVQRSLRQRVAGVQAHLEVARSTTAELESRWKEATADAQQHREEDVRRFCVLLQAKMDKEKDLRRELDGATKRQAFGDSFGAAGDLQGTPGRTGRSTLDNDVSGAVLTAAAGRGRGRGGRAGRQGRTGRQGQRHRSRSRSAGRLKDAATTPLRPLAGQHPAAPSPPASGFRSHLGAAVQEILAPLPDMEAERQPAPPSTATMEILAPPPDGEAPAATRATSSQMRSAAADTTAGHGSASMRLFDPGSSGEENEDAVPGVGAKATDATQGAAPAPMTTAAIVAMAAEVAAAPRLQPTPAVSSAAAACAAVTDDDYRPPASSLGSAADRPPPAPTPTPPPRGPMLFDSDEEDGNATVPAGS